MDKASSCRDSCTCGVIWPHCRYKHLKYLLVWQAEAQQRKQSSLCWDWGLGKGKRGKGKMSVPWKQRIQLTCWHSRRQPAWKHPQIQGQILPGTGLVKNRKDSQQLFSLYDKKFRQVWLAHFVFCDCPVIAWTNVTKCKELVLGGQMQQDSSGRH